VVLGLAVEPCSSFPAPCHLCGLLVPGKSVEDQRTEAMHVAYVTAGWPLSKVGIGKAVEGLEPILRIQVGG
jgi:hypothetical protein